MKLEDIKVIAVIGAGTMGHGIAELMALAGYKVNLRDVNRELVQKGYETIRWSLSKLAEKGQLPLKQVEEVMGRITPVVGLEEAVGEADFAIEAIPENLEMKKELFAHLDRLTPPHAILATNTSSLSITEIGSVTRRPEKVVGMHFFNPVIRMELVEVIKGQRTAEETLELAMALARQLGKVPILVKKDVRGFIVNRILIGPYLFEAAWMVSRGEATVEQIDSCMKYREGFPMGPFELQDLTGIDVGYHLMREAGEPIPPLVEEKVKQGTLGRKTGIGFYNYREGGALYSPEAGRDFDPLPLYALMVNQAFQLLEMGVATADQIDLAMRLGANFPQGILERAERIGLGRILSRLDQLYHQHKEERYRACSLLRARAEQGARQGEG